jgi:hypothetical protein
VEVVREAMQLMVEAAVEVEALAVIYSLVIFRFLEY